MAYHFYPNWLPEGQRSEDEYATKILQEVSAVQERALVTEFGANLNLTEDQKAGRVPSDDAQCLRGLARAVRRLPQLRGALHWHGWHNGDTHDFWEPSNELGSELVLSVLDGCRAVETRPSIVSLQPVALFRKEEMTYLILLSDPRFPQMTGWGWTFERIACYCWPEEGAGQPELMPVQSWRKEEVALYCLADFEPMAGADGFVLEGTAFYAMPPTSNLPNTAAVHEWRKQELTYYAREDCEGYSRLPSWGWTHCRVAFRVPSKVEVA